MCEEGLDHAINTQKHDKFAGNLNNAVVVASREIQSCTCCYIAAAVVPLREIQSCTGWYIATVVSDLGSCPLALTPAVRLSHDSALTHHQRPRVRPIVALIAGGMPAMEALTMPPEAINIKTLWDGMAPHPDTPIADGRGYNRGRSGINEVEGTVQILNTAWITDAKLDSSELNWYSTLTYCAQCFCPLQIQTFFQLILSI